MRFRLLLSLSDTFGDLWVMSPIQIKIYISNTLNNNLLHRLHFESFLTSTLKSPILPNLIPYFNIMAALTILFKQKGKIFGETCYLQK